MAILRQKMGWLGLGVMVVLVFGAWWFVNLSGSSETIAVLAPPADPPLPQEYQQLSAQAAQQIDRLRKDAGLDNDVLACAGLSDELLETVLAGIRNWHESHGAEAVAAQREMADKKARIRRLRSKIDVGPEDEADIPAVQTAEGELATQEAAYRTTLGGLRDSVLAALDETQRSVADVMWANQDVPMPYRAVQLSDQQKRELYQARARHFQGIGGVRNGETRAQLQTQHAQELARILGQDSQQRLAGMASAVSAASHRVVAAVARVLPREPQFAGIEGAGG